MDIPKEIMFDAGPEKFWKFCRCLKVYHAVSLSYSHQINEQTKAYTKLL